jgi:hypothetical protein
MIPVRMTLEHPSVSATPEDSTNNLKVWDKNNESSEQEEIQEETKGEKKPLLADKSGKKTKWYGHFPKWSK